MELQASVAFRCKMCVPGIKLIIRALWPALCLQLVGNRKAFSTGYDAFMFKINLSGPHLKDEVNGRQTGCWGLGKDADWSTLLRTPGVLSLLEPSTGKKSGVHSWNAEGSPKHIWSFACEASVVPGR